MASYWLPGFAMMRVVEGLMLFLFPDMWREAFRRLVLFTNGPFIGMTLSGLLVLD